MPINFYLNKHHFTIGIKKWNILILN
jgi:hypothetical protein